MSQDRTVLISGTTSGLGRALAEKFLSQGYSVIGANRRAEDVFKGNGKFRNHILDISSTEQATSLLQDLKKQNIEPEIFILNAGITDGDFTESLNLDKFRLVLETNLYGALSFVSAGQRLLFKKKTFVFISTTSVYVPNKSSLGYYVAKLGLTHARKLLQFGDPQNKFKVVILGPTITNLNRNLPPLQGFAGKVFKYLSQTPEFEANRIFKFTTNSNSAVLRPPLKTYVFYRLLKVLVCMVPGIYYKPNLSQGER